MADFPTAVPSDGSLYILKNNVATTLNGGVSAGATSMTLASSTLLPPVGFITVETEAIRYGANNTATSVLSSLTRGADSTTAAAHADGTPAYHNYIALHHNNVKDEVIAIAQNIKDRLGLHATVILATGGSASAPSYSFNGNTNCGMYSGTANRVGFSANSVETFVINTSGVTLKTGQLTIPDGSVSAPGFSFENDTNTGIYRVSGDALGIAAGGAAALIIEADVYTTSYTDYGATSTVTGWSVFNTKLIYYKKVGKTVTVWFHLDGTSNSTGASFTLPFTSANTLEPVWTACRAYDNGADLTTPALAQLGNNSATVNCFRTWASGAWTNVNRKIVIGQFVYQTT